MKERNKDKVLILVTVAAAIVWIVTACLLDSEKYFLQIVFVNVICGAWMSLHFWINADYYERKLSDDGRN